MKIFIIMCISLAALIGCRAPALLGKPIFLSQAEETDVEATCSELKSLGNLKDLRFHIHSDVELIKTLLDQGTEDAYSKIRILADQVRVNGEKLKSIIESRFTEIDREQRLIWDLSFPNMGFGPGAKEYWTIEDVTVVKSYSWKGEDLEIADILQIEKSAEGILAKIQRPSSALELCQLQESIIILVKVDLEHRGRVRSFYFKLFAKNRGKE